MLVTAEVLHRIVYNCRLYQVGKNSSPATLSVSTSTLSGSVNDGHIYLEDTEKLPELWSLTDWMVTIQSEPLKELELELRSKEGDIEISRNASKDLVVDGVPYPVEEHYGALDEHQVLNSSLWGRLNDRPFAAMGDRFRKFSLIKTPGEFPMDFVQVWHSLLEREMLVFRAGPTVRGALAVLDREFLKEDVASKEYLWHTGDKRVR